jgi:ATP-dependent Clp protease adaptor protein ClpS
MLRALMNKFRLYCERNESAYAASKLGTSAEKRWQEFAIPPLPAEIAAELENSVEGDLHVIEVQNDDITPMDYVLQVIQDFSKKDRDQAIQLMLKIHSTGSGQLIAGSKNSLDRVSEHIERDASSRKFPLKCVVRNVHLFGSRL